MCVTGHCISNVQKQGICDLSDSRQSHPAHATTLQLKSIVQMQQVINGAAAAFGILNSELPILLPRGPASQDKEISLLAELQ